MLPVFDLTPSGNSEINGSDPLADFSWWVSLSTFPKTLPASAILVCGSDYSKINKHKNIFFPFLKENW